ncbi:transporter substrate-binding domain-containing protein [Paenarthrobacter sp. Z7-10]|uniref:transporter substrate-binding domain-containing protein n=1 Tax=Paenarthrobacter sp. Z7-10 TaxID=2787635 RepID=UPI0022A9A38B|nr:transporter substrate-binding domain-containing protein [Paenarthrobacter sp. Z7-10]MCZ2404022.1 transporter substrate-binding domain-containing protein [Paenarthrobacter sp. Z7-10]
MKLLKHRGARATAAVAVGLLTLGLVACSPEAPGSPAASGSSGATSYDDIISAGTTADAATISANQWASQVKKNGVLHVGGTETSQLFSLLDPAKGKAVGFDAGLSQLLAKYIIGEPKTKLDQVTVDTREDLLVNKSVDAVFATYSITPKREARVDFAGPYYSSQAGILVKSSNNDIKGVADLAGKTVATQAASTGVTLLANEAPKAKVLSLPDHAQALAAVKQGRADAYVIDQSLLLNALVSNKDVKIVGDPFGPKDNYGIGLTKGTDAKAFVNAWLKKIIDDGTWLKLWQATIGAQTGTDKAPTPPKVG